MWGLWLLVYLAGSASAADLPSTVRTFVSKHCIECHDADTARAGFRIDLLTADFSAGNTAGMWKEVMDRVHTGDMPPKKKARPSAQEISGVATWVTRQLDETTKAAQGAGGRVPMRRLNRVEYANTVRDLFALEEEFARRIEKALPADGKVGGFDRGAAGLFMDESQLEQYFAVAELVLDEGVFNPKPEVVKLSHDARNVKYVHGIGVCYRDESGKIIDDNPTPAKVASLKEPLFKITLHNTQQEKAEEYRYIPYGLFPWRISGDGIEYLSGGNNYRNPGNRRSPMIPHDWGDRLVTRDGWYRFRFRAGAFAGSGEGAPKEVRLVVEYGYGSPIEAVKSVLIDAPLDTPKDYELLMYLQAGAPGMTRSMDIGWDNGNHDVIIRDTTYEKAQSRPIVLAGDIERAIGEKKPAEVIAALKSELNAAHAVALESRRTFAGPHWVFDPDLDPAQRPRLWLGTCEWEGPIVEWPPKGRTRLLYAGEDRDDPEYLRSIFERFLPLAYRRPATREEVDQIVARATRVRTERKLSLALAVREGLKHVLCSPAFLYIGGERVAQGKPAARGTGAVPVDGWQLASRLSYLLWSSTPDAVLYELAKRDQLQEPKVLRAQVTRMLADQRSREFVRSFAGQWLGVRNYVNGTPPNRDFYRHYDDPLRDSSRQEPLEFFSEVLRRNLPLTTFLDSDFLVVNERLAKHYGLAGVEGDHFRPVPAPKDGRRGGVLGMAGPMTYLADGTRTLPVRRATWVLDTLWNQPVPPPPPNAGDLPAIKDKQLTVRERLDQHRLSDNCASCHARVDPFGLALENYDATGAWRDRQNGEGRREEADSPTLDVSGALPDGKRFTTVQEFKVALIASRATFVTGFVEKFLCYALGRPVSYGDRIVVGQIIAECAKNDHRLEDIIQATVASAFFKTQ
jgi:hypothetical protein